MQELEQQLLTETKKNEEHTFTMEQLKKDITQHEQVLNGQPFHNIRIYSRIFFYIYIYVYETALILMSDKFNLFCF